MSATTQDTRIRVACAATLLRDAYPANGAKLAARAAGVSHRTAEAWVSGRRDPSASALLRMAETCDRMAAAIERLLHARQVAREARTGVAGDREGAAPSGQQVTK
jgi:transcriptional regulator with XRE-family HTH domain